MPSCVNKGCGKLFTENSGEPCHFHPGAAVFHEGLKGWSCCSKKVADFDEFLKIPGCAMGAHSDKAFEVKKQIPVETSKPSHVDARGVEVYGSVIPSDQQTVNAPQVTISASEKSKVVKKQKEPNEEDLNDPADAIIPIHSKCLRPSCGLAYQGEASRKEKCIFHSGEAVFHEGSKGWSCCSRKVLEFEAFLKIKGCKTGLHRFIEPFTNKIDCRRDWYQTPSTVIVSVFAKKAAKDQTTVSFTNNSVHVNVKFEDGKEHDWNSQLNQPILPELSSFQVLTTKVEIVLKKANGISWPSLEPAVNVKSWTTFGTTGLVGSVGAKEALVATDAPIHQLKQLK